MSDAESFCPIPFLQLELKPTLEVSPCCFLPTYSAGNLGRESLAAIWNGPKMQKLRGEFLDGIPKTCARKMKNIGCHKLQAHLLPHVVPERIQSLPPRRLDVRLNGLCNLSCVMCEVWQEPNGLYEATEFWTKGRATIFPHLLEIDILGGEPFIQKDTFRLIDEISAVNPKCTWGFITNASWKWGPAIEDRLDRIALRYLQVSLDSLDEDRYARIRRGGQFRRTFETLAKLLAYRDRRGFELRLSQCVQQGNWDEIGSFLAFAKARNATPVFQFLDYPREMSLESLSVEKKREIWAALSEWQNVEALHPIRAPINEALNRAK